MSPEAASTATRPQRVFVSYRREESSAYAGRIYDAMVARFGEENVFMDVEMPPGVDFVERIEEVLSGCAVLIVVIGPAWPDIADRDGRPRLHDPADFVRREVAAALRRSDVIVIPALVGGAAMPRNGQLPEDLHPLTRRNALELSDGRWRYDVSRLHGVLDEVVRPPSPQPRPSREPASRPGRQGALAAFGLPLAGALIAALAAFLGRWLGDLTPELAGRSGGIAEVAVQRAPTWGLVGLALAPWLGWRLGRRDLGYLALLGLLAGMLAGIAGALLFALPHKLPQPEVPANQQPGWGVLSLAVTGGGIGALLGWVWRPPRVVVGLLGGLAGGVLGRLLLDGASWLNNEMPDLAISFAILAAFVTVLALVALGSQSSHAANQLGSP